MRQPSETEVGDVVSEYCKKFNAQSPEAAIYKKEGQAALEFLASVDLLKPLIKNYDALAVTANEILAEYAAKNYHIATILTMAADNTLKMVENVSEVRKTALETLKILHDLSLWAEEDPEKFIRAVGNDSPKGKRAASIYLQNQDMLKFSGPKAVFFKKQAEAFAAANLTT